MVAWLLLLCLPGPQDVKKLEERLAKDPDDPAANLAMGKYLAFEKGEWEKGLSHLARGSDKPLAEVAQKEIAGAEDAPAKIALADEWIKVSPKHPKNRQAIHDHATSWYAQAWKALVEGPEKKRLRAKLHQIAGFNPQVAVLKKSGSLPEHWGSGTPETVSWENGFVFDGQRSMRFVPTGREKEMWFSSLQSNPVPTPPPGAKVCFSARVFSNGTNEDFSMGFRFLNSDGKIVSNRDIPVDPDSPFWTPARTIEVVPIGAHRMDVWLKSKSSTGVSYVDAVSAKTEDGREYLRNGAFEK
jgi:hypothetical protein